MPAFSETADAAPPDLSMGNWLVSLKNIAVSRPLTPVPVKYSDFARKMTGLGTIRGIKMESEKDRWFDAMMAAPSAGTLSRPLTQGRKRSRSTGPRKILFMTQ
jgi:hypothetical protein